jgi:hypothetical protein
MEKGLSLDLAVGLALAKKESESESININEGPVKKSWALKIGEYLYYMDETYVMWGGGEKGRGAKPFQFSPHNSQEKIHTIYKVHKSRSVPFFKHDGNNSIIKKSYFPHNIPCLPAS